MHSDVIGLNRLIVATLFVSDQVCPALIHCIRHGFHWFELGAPLISFCHEVTLYNDINVRLKLQLQSVLMAATDWRHNEGLDIIIMHLLSVAI